MRYIVTVKPNYRKGPLVKKRDDGSLLACVREPTIDGEANEAAIKALAIHFGVSKTRVRLIKGHTSRYKVFEVEKTN